MSYQCHIVKFLRFLYLFSLLFWSIFVLYFKLVVDIRMTCILFIPVIIFLFNIYFVSYIQPEDEELSYRTNYLSAGLLIVLPLLSWMNNGYKEDKSKFLTVLLFGISYSLISIIDIWTTRTGVTILRHLRSIFQTLAVTLLISAIYLYFLSQLNESK